MARLPLSLTRTSGSQMRSSRSSSRAVTQLMYELSDTKRSGTTAGPHSDIPPAGKQHFSKSARDLVCRALRKVFVTERMARMSSVVEDDGGDDGDGEVLCVGVVAR